MIKDLTKNIYWYKKKIDGTITLQEMSHGRSVLEPHVGSILILPSALLGPIVIASTLAYPGVDLMLLWKLQHLSTQRALNKSLCTLYTLSFHSQGW